MGARRNEETASQNPTPSAETLTKDVKPQGLMISGMQRKKYPWWRGLRFFAVVWTVAPLAILLVLSVGASAVALRATVQFVAEDYNLAKTGLAAGQLAGNLDTYRQAFRVLASQPGLTSLDPVEIQATLNAYSYLVTDFLNNGGLLVLDAGGAVVTSYPQRPELLGQDFSGQAYFQIRSASPVFFDVTAEPGNERQVVGLVMPLFDEEGDFVGMLVGRFYLAGRQFERFLTPMQQTIGGQAYLVDRQGRVIYHPDPEFVGQDFSRRREIIDLHRANSPGVYLRQQRGTPLEIVSYAPIGGTGWGLVLSVPWPAIARSVQLGVSFVATALLLGVAGLLMLALWAVRRINRALDLLVRQSEQVAAGTYDSQVSLSRISELRALGVAFNHMVRQIESYRRGVQEYVASVTNSQEEERKRIARDLHDGTVQSLIAIGQRIELARASLDEDPLPQIKEQLTEVRAMVTEAIASTRQFSRDLRPLALEDLGLVPALHFLVSRLDQDMGIKARLEIEGDATGLSADLETTVYRLTQEALNNIRKHAQANQVLVTIRFRPRQTILEVQDNGVGFEVPHATTELARRGSFGLMGMEERANLFGGAISVQSAPGRGTTLLIILPHKQMPRV